MLMPAFAAEPGPDVLAGDDEVEADAVDDDARCGKALGSQGLGTSHLWGFEYEMVLSARVPSQAHKLLVTLDATIGFC
jgi:hypothetical protein